MRGAVAVAMCLSCGLPVMARAEAPEPGGTAQQSEGEKPPEGGQGQGEDFELLGPRKAPDEARVRAIAHGWMTCRAS